MLVQDQQPANPTYVPAQGLKESYQGQQGDGSNNLNQFPMSEFDLGDVINRQGDISFDENSGNLQMNFLNRIRQDQKQAAQDQQRVTDEFAGRQQQQQQQAKNPYEDRMNSLETLVQQQHTVLQQFIPMMLGFMQGNPQQAQVSQTPQYEYDLSDANQLKLYMQNEIKSSIESALKPILQILPQMAQQIGFANASTQYGQESSDLLPHVRQLLHLNPGMSVEQAFQFVAGIKKGSNGNGHSGHIPAQPQQTNSQKLQGTAEQFMQMVNGVKTERGVNPGLKGAPEIKSLRDAMAAAKLQLSGG